MSDTPIVNRASEGLTGEWVRSNLARQLERELNEANKEVIKQKKLAATIQEQFEEALSQRDQASSRVLVLDGLLDAAKIDAARLRDERDVALATSRSNWKTSEEYRVEIARLRSELDGVVADKNAAWKLAEEYKAEIAGLHGEITAERSRVEDLQAKLTAAHQEIDFYHGVWECNNAKSETIGALQRELKKASETISAYEGIIGRDTQLQKTCENQEKTIQELREELQEAQKTGAIYLDDLLETIDKKDELERYRVAFSVLVEHVGGKR